jgi:hypothetical protein
MVGEMSNIEGINFFGKLTIKTQTEHSENALSGVSENEVSLIENSNEHDSVELSTASNDENINEDNIVIWQQENQMQAAVNTLKAQVLKDFALEDTDDIIGILNKINEFKADFKEQYLKENSASGMASAFSSALVVEYESIKDEARKNTKSAIKDRVIEEITDEIINDKEKGGRMLLGVVDTSAMTVSEDIKKQIIKELEKESDKFIKNYSDSNLEEDLANHLREFIAQTDKEKLSGAIEKWDEDKAVAEKSEQNDKNKLRQLKENAKSFLTSAILMGVPIELGNVTIRTEVAIPQALSQYDSPEALREALDYAISQISSKSRQELIREKINTTEKIENKNLFSYSPRESSTNFFKNK